jgi:hypothetical protein
MVQKKISPAFFITLLGFLCTPLVQATRVKKISILARENILTGVTDTAPAHLPLLPTPLEENQIGRQQFISRMTHLNLRKRKSSREKKKVKNHDFSFSDFQDSVFDTEFKECTLSFSSFIGATLTGTLQQSTVHHTLFREADFSNLYAHNSNFSHSSFSYLKSCQGAEFLGCVFDNCQFIKANLSKSVFCRSTFKKANLSHAFLGESLFEHVCFQNANLEHANLTNTDCASADFKNANLSKAILENTNLSESTLKKADLSGAIFFKTDLRGADLSDAILDGTSFLDALINKDTQGNISLMLACGARFVEEEE